MRMMAFCAADPPYCLNARDHLVCPCLCAAAGCLQVARTARVRPGILRGHTTAGGKIVGAAHGAFCPHSQGGQQHFVPSEQKVEPTAVEANAAAVVHQIFVRVLDAGQIRNATGRLR